MSEHITCQGTDILESVILKNEVHEIQYLNNGHYQSMENIITDLTTRDGHEYLHLKNGDVIDAIDVIFVGPHYIYNPFQEKIDRVIHALKNNRESRPLVPMELDQIVDISMSGKDIGNRDPDEWVTQHVVDGYAKGGYGENRDIYAKSEHFGKDDRRTIHLGIDVWTPPRTPLLAPLDGHIHSFRDNDNFGDYGPTIILEHSLGDEVFYTLHGHLTRDSLSGIKRGQKIKKGEQFALIGEREENGNWYPHVHTEIVVDLMGKEGDFPGVAKPREASFWMSMCPNPQYLFNYSFD